MNALRSALNSVSGTLIHLFIGLVGMIVLARLVPVEDHGVYALSYAVYLVFQPFLDFGMTPVYLKLDKVTLRIKSVFFTFNVYLGILIAACLILLSPLVVTVFNNPVLYPLLSIQAVAVVFMCLGNQPISQLFRQKKFFIAEAVRNVSAFLALVIAIYLAFTGWGIWALAAKFVLHGFFRWVSAWIAVRPKYVFVSLRELKHNWESIRFGGFITVSRILAGYANNLDKFIIGKTFGELYLGHYEKALLIVDKPNSLRNALTTPAISHLARLKQSSYPPMYHLMTQLFLAAAGVPALFFCSMVRN